MTDIPILSLIVFLPAAGAGVLARAAIRFPEMGPSLCLNASAIGTNTSMPIRGEYWRSPSEYKSCRRSGRRRWRL